MKKELKKIRVRIEIKLILLDFIFFLRKIEKYKLNINTQIIFKLR